MIRAAWVSGLGWAMLMAGNIGPGAVADGATGPIAGATELVAGSRFGFVAMNSGELRVFTPAGVLIRRVWRPDGPGNATAVGHRAGTRQVGIADAADTPNGGVAGDTPDSELTTGALSIASLTPAELADPDAIDFIDFIDSGDIGGLGDDAAAMMRHRPPRERGGAREVGDGGGVGGVATLAVGDHHAWIGRGDGLWRLTIDDGALILGALGRVSIAGVAVSSNGKLIAAVANGQLERSSDGGNTFTRIAALSGRLRNIAISTAGDVLFGDDSGARRAPPGSTRADSVDAHLPMNVQDVIACGDHFGVVAEGRFVDFNPQLTPPDSAPVVLPVGATRVLCLEGDTRVAYGDGIWTSLDRGRHWTPRDNPAAGIIRTLAVSAERLWLGTSSGLWALPLDALATPTRAAPLSAMAKPARPTARSNARGTPEHAPAGSSLWLRLLPRISMSLAAWRARDHLSVLGLVTATFTLDPTPLARATRDRVPRAYDRSQLEWTDAVHDTLPSTHSGPTAGEEADEEQQALTRIQGTSEEGAAQNSGGIP